MTSDGQVIGAVVAESATLAWKAAQAVIVEYEDLPAIFTIQVQLVFMSGSGTVSEMQ